MMVEEGKKLNSMYIVPELLEEIFLRLPLKPINKFKVVSKQWRSILRSKSFVERRKSLQKSRWKIMAAYNSECRERPESQFEGDEDINFLPCNYTQRAAMLTCDGLVCFPDQRLDDCVIVLNPSTRQLWRFHSKPAAVYSLGFGWENCVMGFGKDKVTGRYKVVRMFFDSSHCEILDLGIGKWRKLLSPPPYKLRMDGRHEIFGKPRGRKSVCVNGSIYWLTVRNCFKILALNLHTQTFHDVSVPDTCDTRKTEVVNLEDRLAIATTDGGPHDPDWELVIHSMDAEEVWSKTYSINLAGVVNNQSDKTFLFFTPLTVSKLGDVLFCDNHKGLFKYHPRTNEVQCLSLNICVISPYLENLLPLRSKSGYQLDMENMIPPYESLSTHPGASSATLDTVFITRFILLVLYVLLSTVIWFSFYH